MSSARKRTASKKSTGNTSGNYEAIRTKKQTDGLQEILWQVQAINNYTMKRGNDLTPEQERLFVLIKRNVDAIHKNING